MSAAQAHQNNIDAAQRELDGRSAEGEDVSHLRVCEKTAAIVSALDIPGGGAASLAAELARPLSAGEQALAADVTAPALILNKSQAEAVYRAICALNNIGARLHQASFLMRDGIHAEFIVDVRERAGGQIVVDGRTTELHDSQAAFAEAYGLN